MTAIVPETCPLATATGIVNADPVRGVTWQDIGASANHLLGRGGVLIPTTCLYGTTIAKGATATYQVAIFPRYQATHRMWTFGLAPSGGAQASVTFTDPSGGTTSREVTDRTPPRVYTHLETISGRTAAEDQKTFTIAVAGASVADCQPLTIGCYEIARPELALDASDLGVDLAGLYGGLPIYAATGKSIGGVIDGIEAAVSTAKRNGILYVLAQSGDPFSFTTTSYVDPLSGTSIEVLERQKYRSETVRAMSVSAYGLTGATTTMDVRISAANGDSLVLSWTAGDTGSWKSGTLDLSVEDLSHATGGATSDQIVVAGKRTTGANAAHLLSVCVGGT